MPRSQFDLESLEAIIVARFPELTDRAFTLLSDGWDSVAVDVDDRLIFKFPRHPRGADALRREAAILRVVGPAVSMPVPALELFETPVLFSRHIKIAGEHLLTAQYAKLGESERQRLGEALGLFYAELHKIDVSVARTAGALPAESWLSAEEILRRSWPVLPEEFRAFAETTMAGWAALSEDPLGEVFGYFDGHGWNMAFDPAKGVLNGLYDFADSGIGPLHQEFICSNLIATDLTARIIGSYEQHSGRSVDRERIDLLTGTQRLWELADQTRHVPEHLPGLINGVATWALRS